MKDLNNVSLTGRLCADPELKYTPSGVAVCSFRMAVNKGREENGKTADFLSVEAWRQTAEYLANYVHKGDQVAVTGRIRVRDWTAQDGSKRTTVEIVAHEVNGLGRKQAAEEAAGPAAYVDETAAAADFNDPFADE